MKTILRVFFPTILIFSTCIALLVFKTMPAAALWEAYSVLYVQNSVPESDILSYLENEGCSEVISASVQKNPLVSSITPISPVDSSYLQKRFGYFADESGTYNLFYIPSSQNAKAKKALKEIVSKTGASCGLDGRERFTFASPIICAVLFVIFLFSCRYKSVFVLPAIFPLAFAFSRPFPLPCAAVCLDFLCLFLINGSWKRRGYFSAILKNPVLIILFFTSIFCTFASSVQTGLLYILTFSSQNALIYLEYMMSKVLEEEKSFVYTPIFSARQLPILRRKTIPFTFFASIPLLAILAFFLFSASFVARGSTSLVSLPTPFLPSSTNGLLSYGEELPSANDYFVWVWNIETFPYRNLNGSDSFKTVQYGDQIIVDHYRETSSGIQNSREVLFEYNDDFTNEIKKNVQNLDYPAIEKLLVSEQRENFHVAYNHGGFIRQNSQSQNARTLLVLITALSEPILIGVLYLINGRKR